MNEMPVSDRRCLLAAVGWLELGNATEAAEELRAVSAAFQAHPEVLETRWMILADQKNWEEALVLAQTLREKYPERASSWIHHAYALRRVKTGGLEKAREVLLAANKQFPKEDMIPFNLACYAAQLGRLSEAWEWLHQAMEAAGNVDLVKKRALTDPDLAPLWDRIRGL